MEKRGNNRAVGKIISLKQKYYHGSRERGSFFLETCWIDDKSVRVVCTVCNQSNIQQAFCCTCAIVVMIDGDFDGFDRTIPNLRLPVMDRV